MAETECAVTLPLFPLETMPSPARSGQRVVFVAWRDLGEEMAPAQAEGRLLLFEDLAAARAAAGCLGTASATPRARLGELCRRYGLAAPAGDG